MDVLLYDTHCSFILLHPKFPEATIRIYVCSRMKNLGIKRLMTLHTWQTSRMHVASVSAFNMSCFESASYQVWASQGQWLT